MSHTKRKPSQPMVQPMGRPGKKQERPKKQGAAHSATHGWAVWILLPALLLVVLAAYHPAWHGGMLWDDDMHVTRPELRSWQGLYRIWFDVGATLQYYPLLHSVFWLGYKIWGDATLGYHLLNILMHAAAVLMLGLILRRLAVPGAWLAAAIFALHPVQVESVAWIAELKNTLSTVFYLGAAMLYLRFDESRRRTFYLGALGVFLLALLSKTVTATLPGGLLVVFWWQRGKLTWKKDVVPLVPFFVVGAGCAMITAWWELKINKCVGPDFQFSIVDRLLIAGRAVWFHLGKLFWPVDLAFIYPRWRIDPGVAGQYLFPLAAVGSLAVLWAFRRWSRAPLAGVLYFCGTLFPVLGFFNLYTFRYSLIANHYQYLAGAGIISLVSAGGVLLLDRLGLRHRVTRYALCTLLLATLWGLTWRESRQYADAETLYNTTISRNPSCWMAHNNLGIALQKQGRLEEAVEHFHEALRLKPDHADAHNNLGNALQRQGRLEEAVAQYEEALRLEPDDADTHYNLGNALQGQGRPKEAVVQYKEALRLKPDDEKVYNNLGNAFQQLGSYQEAAAQYREVLKQAPDSVEAHNNLGVALVRLGQLEDAAMHFKEALRLKPDDGEAYNNLGAALRGLGRTEEAAAQYKAAERFKPEDGMANNLGNVLQQQGSNQEAAEQNREALKQAPGSAEAHNNLGVALMSQGQFEEAAMHFKEALRLEPDYAEAHYNLGNALHGQGRLKEAVAQYKEALRLKPDYVNAYNNLGNLLQQLGSYQEAAVQYRAALKQAPGSAEVHNNLGVALARLGQLEEAAVHFKEALRLKPNYADAQANLDDALSRLKKANRSHP